MFFKPNNRMLFGDAKASCDQLLALLSQKGGGK